MFGEAETTGEDFKLKTVLNMHSTEPSVLCDLIEWYFIDETFCFQYDD